MRQNGCVINFTGDHIEHQGIPDKLKMFFIRRANQYIDLVPELRLLRLQPAQKIILDFFCLKESVN